MEEKHLYFCRLSAHTTKYILFIFLMIFTTPALSENQNNIQLPVRIYLMSFDEAPQLNSTYNTAYLRKMLREVNKIWHQARITWVAEKVIRINKTKEEFEGVANNETRGSFRAKMVNLSPSLTEKKLWQVVIIRKFPIPASGVYLPEKKTIFYGELNKNGEEHFLILAHELGHSLGLKHTQDKNNLMAGRGKNPNTSFNLNDRQISQTRTQAIIGPFEKNKNFRKDQLSKKKRIVDRILSFDMNNDGEISYSEAPKNSRRAFKRIDQDKNGLLTKTEIDEFLNFP